MMEINDNLIQERYDLSLGRIGEMIEEKTVQAPFREYFEKVAAFILFIDRNIEKQRNGLETLTLEQWQNYNEYLYQDIYPKNYEASFCNPEYAIKKLGEIHGRILSFLYTEVRSMIAHAYEGNLQEMTVVSELFIEVYNCFEEEEPPSYRRIQQIVYWYASDYSEIFVSNRIVGAIDASLDFAVNIVMKSDLSDMRYLYRYGEYVSYESIKMAEYLNSLSEEKIIELASVMTEGFRRGFIAGNMDLSRKRTVNIRYQLGFERIVRRAVINYEAMGLKTIIYRVPVNSVNRGLHQVGYHGASVNPQYYYDHKADNSIYLDKLFVERKLGVTRAAYEQYKELANVHAGPCCIETFGEEPFVPITKAEAYYLSEKQQELQAYFLNESNRITNQYIRSDERSFTVIAFPVPEIGEQFQEIFDEVVKINTLDYVVYECIQQKLIDALDTGVSVRIRGRGENRTDLTVALHSLKNREKETLFENCVADVNIPVGEVFTSPKLEGTNGILHVSKVYLNKLQYQNLTLVFENGNIKEYDCSNFEKLEENKRIIRENILHHHKTLPLGEFAIGTNTTAYAVAEKYHLKDKFPILIAEKMGPHFAVGDTCYSWSEDVRIYNPDGKEIVAKDNEISILRKENSKESYFSCHTDITVPYGEIGILEVIKEDGTTIPLIKEGRFALDGTKELNLALDGS